jgi:uncharacterized spore protein YtfJ
MFSDVSDTLETIRSGIAERLSAHTAFGEPVQNGNVTVIPVAKVAMGFGAGGGIGEDAHHSDNGGSGGGIGGGGGGGGIVNPLGFIEVTDTGSRWVPLEAPPTELAIRALTIAAVLAPIGGRRGLIGRLLIVVLGQAIASRMARPDMSSLPEGLRFGRSFSTNQSA